MMLAMTARPTATPPPPATRARRRTRSSGVLLLAPSLVLLPLLVAQATAANANATTPPLLTPPADLARLLGGALPPAPSACTEAVRRGVVWGVATSAAQIEGGASAGGRTPSIWDVFAGRSSPSPIAGGATPSVAADHYHKYEQDFDLMQSLGVKAHRFSISWSRLVPGGKAGSPVSREGADFYRRLARAMLERGITPVATLYHWDLPQSLQDAYGGWLSPRVVDDFEHYASSAFAALDGLVKHWITINEPGVICDQVRCVCLVVRALFLRSRLCFLHRRFGEKKQKRLPPHPQTSPTPAPPKPKQK